MSMFDPLGLISTLTIRGKILMQKMWRSGISWGSFSLEELIKPWQRWMKDLRKVADYKIPRCYSFLIPGADRIELHTFYDSSEESFATVYYLRVLKDDSIIAAKTRVAPLKQLSILRLELQAAVMGSRLAETIKLELEITINRMYFWTDSKCVLGWIRADGRSFKQFVALRIGEIQERRRIEDWQWVPSRQNIADYATRSSKETIICDD
ncbi:uncharacterized protein [Leptinotarsa decemlineata]|uniref:uncharacterized protein n=1 Tax=Leptinotarsa decemlineata TaxID=7539 RepID=UPI003D307DDA